MNMRMSAVWEFLDNHEYFLMIFSHVLMLVVYPFLVDTLYAELGMRVLISLILITWLYAAHSHHKFVLSTLLLGVTSFVLTWLSYAYASEFFLSFAVYLMWLLFFCVILYNLIMDLHTMRNIDQHMIFGAIAGYLIVWLIGAFVFALIELLVPGSFTWFMQDIYVLPDFIYYSYVSITTLWYGDIIPIWYHAQSWSIIFTLWGQMYLAVLIGMLVGKYVKK